MRPRSNTLLVWTGAPCSYGCGACPIDTAASTAGFEPADLQRALASTAVGAQRLAVLVGGEPFLRRDVFGLLAGVRAAGWTPGMITTGRALLYPHVRQRLRRAGLAYLRLQLFGIAAAHDRAVGVAGAYEQALAAVRAWLEEAGAECDVDVALSMRGRAIETAAAEVDILARQISSSEVQIVVAVDAGAEPQDLDSMRRALAVLAGWNEDPRRPLLSWEGLPESVSSACGLAVSPLRPAFLDRAPQACCLGAVPAIAEAAAARPQEPRANSFNFIRTATSVPWTADPAACTAHAAAAGDTGRHLWLVEEGLLRLYVTDTGDFEIAEIGRVKDEWSHLFVDCAEPGVLDDFVGGMRRVRPEATCEPCVNRQRCGRRFAVVEGPPFAREEAWIAAHVAGVRGRVLDVGCGEQLYREQLAPLLRSGAVDYHGLDPDEPSLAAARAALPEGHYYLGGIEEFRGGSARFDHILSLRSLNHVLDLDEALARMAEMLEPGGTLLLVETTPFAMLRRAEQVTAADRAPRAGHQHFRNLTSAEVLPMARRRRLEILHHHPVGREATNEWILLLAKPRR